MKSVPIRRTSRRTSHRKRSNGQASGNLWWQWGKNFIPHALVSKADVYITGDIYYHTAEDMQSAGLAAIDPGHYIESLCKEKFIEKFESWKKEEDWSIDFFVSETDTNPFQFN